MEKKTQITYRRVGDFLIPNLILPPEEANITLGKWGMMYKSYLEKHKSPLFDSLLIKGKLYQHCAEVENQARDMFDTLVEQMKEKMGHDFFDVFYGPIVDTDGVVRIGEGESMSDEAMLNNFDWYVEGVIVHE